MQVVKQTSFGELMDVTRYTLYLSATEYNDIRELLNLIVIPFPSGSEEEILRIRLCELLNHYQIKRLSNLCSQFNLELR